MDRLFNNCHVYCFIDNIIFMVADNWVKKNPLISGLLGVALTCVCSIALAKATWSREDRRVLEIELEKKADLSYVKEQDSMIRDEINSTQRLFLEEIRELRKDLRLKKDK